MTVRQLAFGFTLAAGFVCAQSSDTPEIRGTVIEPVFNIGVTGAEVTLFEFVLDEERTVVRTQVSSTSSDTGGEFRFRLQHFGDYYVEVKKEGYLVPVLASRSGPPASTGARVEVRRDHQSQEVRFLLTRPGEITGRVIDEEGNPVADLRVAIQNTPMPSDLVLGAVTDHTGTFAIKKLPPGGYLVRVSPKSREFETVTQQFSEEDARMVELDFEASYWPGGVVDPGLASPVAVSPGATSSLGTITLRRVPYHRARVSVPGVDCQPKESWMFSVLPRNVRVGLSYVSVPCGNELLVRNLKPGSYLFALRSEKPSRWALADVDVTRANVEVSLAMMRAAELKGRIIAAEGAKLPMFEQVGIIIRVRMGAFLGWAATSSPNAEGQFVVRDLPFVPHDVSVRGLDSRHYLKEIRYNGVVMADGMVTPASGAPAQNLEIVLDDKPGTITGSVHDGDQPISKPFVLVVRWPFTEGDALSNAQRPASDDHGRFQISGLAPGEYRVIALTKSIFNTEISNQLLNRAEKVTLDRGGSQDVSLKLIDPSK